MEKKHYLVVQNERAVACCDDNNSKEQLSDYTGAGLFELEDGDRCPICSDEEE